MKLAPAVLACLLAACPTWAAGEAGGSAPAAPTATQAVPGDIMDEQARQKQEESTTCRGERLDPYVVWKDVEEREDVEPLLRSAYGRIGSIEGLADWLRCQGFSASILQGPVHPGLQDGERVISATFMLYDYVEWREPLWGSYWFGQPVRHSIIIQIDRDGSIRSIGANDMYK